MNLLDRILCWAGLHKPPPRIKPKDSIRWTCDRCGEVLPGRQAVRR